MVRLYFTEMPRLPDRKAMRAAEHAAGRRLVCEALGCLEDDIRIRDDGKPYLPGGPHFSISHCESYGCSHCGGLVLLAVSGAGEIGCDVEPADRPLHNEEAIRKKIAAPGEEGIPLLKLWVKKEAVFKAGGPGEVFYPEVPAGFIAAVCCREEEP